MSGTVTDNDRKIIPRWRTFDQSLDQLHSIKGPKDVRQEKPHDLLYRKRIEWNANPTSVKHASDLLGSAIALGMNDEVTDVAKTIVDLKRNVSYWVYELAMHVLEPPPNIGSASVSLNEIDELYMRKCIRSTRQSVRNAPRDAIRWVHLAKYYTSLGLTIQAAKSMHVALYLAPTNRFVLRSASRLWVHVGDIEKGHGLIRRSRRTKFDPWLLSVEIALSDLMGKPPALAKKGQKYLRMDILPVHISELASALATLELGHGRMKKSKILFKQSLQSPTENSVAQAAWAQQKTGVIQLEENDFQHPNTFEARFWSHIVRSKWENAITQCDSWVKDESYSSEPYVHGSYLTAVVTENFQSCKHYATRGLISNPLHPILLNNLAYAQIMLGNLQEAETNLNKLNSLKIDNDSGVSVQATRGLLQFRKGNIQSGRQLYLKACNQARSIPGNRGRALFAMASARHAFEEIALGIGGNRSIVQSALMSLKRVKDPIFRVVSDNLIQAQNQAFYGREMD